MLLEALMSDILLSPASHPGDDHKDIQAMRRQYVSFQCGGSIRLIVCCSFSAQTNSVSPFQHCAMNATIFPSDGVLEGFTTVLLIDAFPGIRFQRKWPTNRGWTLDWTPVGGVGP